MDAAGQRRLQDSRLPSPPLPGRKRLCRRVGGGGQWSGKVVHCGWGVFFHFFFDAWVVGVCVYIEDKQRSGCIPRDTVRTYMCIMPVRRKAIRWCCAIAVLIDPFTPSHTKEVRGSITIGDREAEDGGRRIGGGRWGKRGGG